MKFAFKKDTKSIFAKLCTWKMDGPYHHIEVLFGEPSLITGQTLCGSSAFLDGGVRLKGIDVSDPNVWDIIEVPSLDMDDEKASYKWFQDHTGDPYDVRGLIQFITPFPVGHTKNGWFCDEAALASIGMEKDGFRFDPNAMFALLDFMNKQGDLKS